MQLELPSTARELQAVIERWAQDKNDGPVPTTPDASELADIGVLDLLLDDSSGSAQVHAAAAVEATGRAGLLLPVPETLWARSEGQAADEAIWVASPTAVGREGQRFVPLAQHATALIVGTSDTSPTTRPIPTRGPSHVAVHPEGCWVELADDQLGFTQLAPGLAWRTYAAMSVGLMGRSLSLALDHLRDRRAFRRRLLTFQAPRFRLSDVHWRLEGLRLLVREAAWRADRHDPRAETVSALAWLHARRTGHAVARHLHQAMGAMGFQDETGVIRLTGTLATLRLAVPATDAAACVWNAYDRRAEPPRSTTLEALTATRS